MDLLEILKKIMPYKTLGMNVENEGVDSLTMSISLSENLNDKNTLFAGSIYSVIVLCGWALAYKILNNDIKSHDIVIKHSNVNYLFPVKTNALAIAKVNGKLITKTNKNKSIQITVLLKDANNKICAEFTGEYIGIKI